MWDESLTPTVRAQYGRISGCQDRGGWEVGKDLRPQVCSFAHDQMNNGEKPRAVALGLLLGTRYAAAAGRLPARAPIAAKSVY